MPSSPSPLNGQPCFANTELARHRVRVFELLGHGGNGRVYRGTHRGAPAALKFVPRPYADGELVHHSRVGAHGGHRNVLGMKAAFTHRAHTVLVLDLCKGGDLFDVLASSALPWVDDEEVLRALFLQLIDALAHCHTRSVFHGDLKPENVLYSPEDKRVLLADFGGATDQAQCAAPSGTDFFAAPEAQALHERARSPALPAAELQMIFAAHPTFGDTYDAAGADVWALGMLFLQMLAASTTTRAPMFWERSCVLDADFAAFMRAGPADWAERVVPGLTLAALGLLARMVDPLPARRPGLVEVRACVAGMRAFTLSAAARLDSLAEDVVPLGENASCQPSGPIPVETAPLFERSKQSGPMSVEHAPLPGNIKRRGPLVFLEGLRPFENLRLLLGEVFKHPVMLL